MYAILETPRGPPIRLGWPSSVHLCLISFLLMRPPKFRQMRKPCLGGSARLYCPYALFVNKHCEMNEECAKKCCPGFACDTCRIHKFVSHNLCGCVYNDCLGCTKHLLMLNTAYRIGGISPRTANVSDPLAKCREQFKLLSCKGLAKLALGSI